MTKIVRITMAAIDLIIFPSVEGESTFPITELFELVRQGTHIECISSHVYVYRVYN